MQQVEYEDIEKYRRVMNKIKISSDIEEEKSKYFLIGNTVDKTELYFNLNEAISEKKSLKILYRNLNQEWQERVIHPLQMFCYGSKLYVTAFCELRDDIRHFEVDRIRIYRK